MRQRAWIALPFLVAAVAVAWGLSQRQAERRDRNFLEAAYQRDFANVVDHAEQLQVTLGKAVAAGTPGQQTMYLTEIWFRASEAQGTLSQLPVTRVSLLGTRKFLAQIGDYARTVARDTSEGKKITGEQVAQIGRFEDEMARLSGQLNGLQARLAANRFRWTANLAAGPEPRRAATIRAGVGPDFQAFNQVEERLRKMPALIYNGPFSDHIEEIKPRAITGATISVSRATEIAHRFADLPPGRDLRPEGQPRKVEGRLPAFSVTLRERGDGGGRIVVDISRQGGHVLLMMNDRRVNTMRMDADQAMAEARTFLDRRGYGTLVPTHTLREANAQVFAFAGHEDNAVVYPDQVKVKVALDNGQVVGFDATQYLTAHHQRKLPRPKLSPDEARAKVGDGLNTESVRLTVIPVAGAREALAYEVRARRNNATYLIYINAATGEEENILKLVDTPSGRLVM